MVYFVVYNDYELDGAKVRKITENTKFFTSIFYCSTIVANC